MKRDPERTVKWAERAVEWQRLAFESRDDHVADVCADMAKQSMMMAEFWNGK